MTSESSALQVRHVLIPSVPPLSCPIDFLPRPRRDPPGHASAPKPLLPWLIRRVECIRGTLPILMQCAPAFNYARSTHTTTIIDDDSIPDRPHQKKTLFKSDALSLDLRYVTECSVPEAIPPTQVTLELLDLSAKGHKGLAVQSLLELKEGQSVTFILRHPPAEERTDVSAATENTAEALKGSLDHHKRRPANDPFLTTELVSSLLHVSYIILIPSFFLTLPPIQTTIRYWYEWVSQSTYTGSWKEAVLRSALALKLLIFEQTGNLFSN